MGIGEWVAQNWFDALSAIGIIASFTVSAISLRSEARTRRVSNLIALTENHRELWKDFYRTPDLARILDPNAELALAPVTLKEEEFFNLVIQHLSSVYRAMKTDLTYKPEAVRHDVSIFFLLPIPLAVWNKVKKFQDRDFAQFIEESLREKQ